MADHDPLELLREMADEPRQPDPEFRDRLLVDLFGSSTEPQLTKASSRTNTPNEVLDLMEDNGMRRTRSGRTLAMAAAAALLVVVIGAIAVNREGDRKIVTDEPAAGDGDASVEEAHDSNETGEPPGDRRLEIGDTFVAAMYSGDVEKLLEMSEPSAGAWVFETLPIFSRTLNAEVVSHTCEAVGSSIVVSCAVQGRDDISRTIEDDFFASFDLSINDDGKITGVVFRDEPTPAGDAFTSWAQANHPDILTGVCDGTIGIYQENPTPGECADALLVIAEEYSANQD